MANSEFKEQQLFNAWMNKNRIIHYAVPNGGYKNTHVARGQKMIGVMPGVPDYCIPIANKDYHGLYIEMKRADGGTISEFQERWLKELGDRGYKAVIAYGAEEAIEIVKEYLGESNDK